MTEPQRVVVTKAEWDERWNRYRALIGGTLETQVPERTAEEIMRDFERLRGELEDGRTYWRFQRDRLDAIYKRRNAKEPECQS